jgi:hypothetical protein
VSAADPFELARAKAMLCGYDARWADDMDRYEVLGVELEFAAPLVNPLTRATSRTWRIGGKLDVMVRERATRRDLIVEHKTASVDVGAGSEYWRRLRMDGQVSIYFDGARALGYDPQACLYDVLAKTGLRPSAIPVLDEAGVKIVLAANGERVRTKDGKKWRETGDTAAGYVVQTRPETPEEYLARLIDAIAEDPNRFYQRGEVVRLEQEIEEAQHDIWQLGKQVRESDLAGRFPRNPDACVRYGQTCSFFDVCTGAASLSDETRFRRVSEYHSELPQASAEVGRGFDLLTASRLSSARACQRLHKLRYVDGYRPAVDAEALRFGTLIHRGLEAWWLAPAGADRLELALAALTAEPTNQRAPAHASA